MTIPDPTLYGPPTFFQWARERLKAQAAWWRPVYEEAARPIVDEIKRYPRDIYAKERLMRLEQAARQHLDAIAKPYIDILMCEPPNTIFLLEADGTLTAIDERVPLMGLTPP